MTNKMAVLRATNGVAQAVKTGDLWQIMNQSVAMSGSFADVYNAWNDAAAKLGV